MENKNLLLIDGDIILYRTAHACKDATDWKEVQDYIWKAMNEMCQELGTTRYIGFLQGKTNFRNDVPSPAKYKGNRSGTEKPFWWPNIQQYLIKVYGFELTDGIESDDALTILQTRLADRNPVICSIDKDLLQCEGRHYNLNSKEISVTTPERALHCLAMQIIIGDSTDNIKGLFRVGEVKAAKMLENVKPEQYLERALSAYIDYYADPKQLPGALPSERFMVATRHFSETFQLVYLLLTRDEELFPTPEEKDLLLIENAFNNGGNSTAIGEAMFG